MRDFFSRGYTLVKEVLSKTAAQAELGHIRIFLSLLGVENGFRKPMYFFVSQTQETAKVIIAVADRPDASTKQNTSSSRQGLSVYRLRCHCFERYIVYIAFHFRLLILDIEDSGC